MGFTRQSIEDVGDKWDSVEPFNAILEELRTARLPAVLRIGDAAVSKLVWKIRGLKQFVLYRAVMLADGCASAWGAKNVLTSVLCARALLETAALVFNFVEQLSTLLEKGDFAAIDKLVTNRTFATRLPNWLKDGEANKSVNILTFIDHLDKSHHGMRAHYDRLSEICHPNYAGLSMTFSTLDVDTGTHVLDEHKMMNEGMLSHVLGGFMCIALIKSMLARLEALLPRVLEFSEKEKKGSSAPGKARG